MVLFFVIMTEIVDPRNRNKFKNTLIMSPKTLSEKFFKELMLI